MKIEAGMRMTVKMRGFPLEWVKQSAIPTGPELGKGKRRGEGEGATSVIGYNSQTREYNWTPF
jgi:hypothetical protein